MMKLIDTDILIDFSHEIFALESITELMSNYRYEFCSMLYLANCKAMRKVKIIKDNDRIHKKKEKTLVQHRNQSSFMKRYPFLLVVDDGGRPYLKEGSQHLPVTMQTYQLLLEIAQSFEIILPVAYVFRYLDVNNLSGLGGALDYADELIDFMHEYEQQLPIFHHGLTHGYDYIIGDPCWTGTHAEFFDIDHGRSITEEQQARHIAICDEICKELALDTPEVFVPPCHAWEPGVTDRLLAASGITQIITVSRLRFQGRIYRYDNSPYLRVLPRKPIGISHNMIGIALNSKTLKKALRTVIPMNWFWCLREHRKFSNPLMHSYYVHVTNFMPDTREFWFRFFDAIRSRSNLYFPQNPADALKAFDEGGQQYEP